MSDTSETHPKLLTTFFDCNDISDAEKYSLTSVDSCKIPTDDIQTEPANIQFFHRKFTAPIPAFMCSLKYTYLRYFCGMYSHSSISLDSKLSAVPYVLTAEQCSQLIPKPPLTESFLYIYTLWGSSIFKIKFQLGKTTETIVTIGKKLESNNYDCEDHGFVNSWTFQATLYETKLTYNHDTHTVHNHNGLQLPCKISQGGCGSTLIGKFAYAWDKTVHCNIEPAGIVEAQHIKWNDRYFLIRDHHNISMNRVTGKIAKDTAFKIEIFPKPSRFCKHIDPLYQTNHDSLKILLINGGFNMQNGKPNNNFQQLKEPPIYKIPTDTLFTYEKHMKRMDTRYNGNKAVKTSAATLKDWEINGIDANITSNVIDLALHESVKLDYIIHQNQQR